MMRYRIEGTTSDGESFALKAQDDFEQAISYAKGYASSVTGTSEVTMWTNDDGTVDVIAQGQAYAEKLHIAPVEAE